MQLVLLSAVLFATSTSAQRVGTEKLRKPTLEKLAPPKVRCVIFPHTGHLVDSARSPPSSLLACPRSLSRDPPREHAASHRTLGAAAEKVFSLGFRKAKIPKGLDHLDLIGEKVRKKVKRGRLLVVLVCRYLFSRARLFHCLTPALILALLNGLDWRQRCKGVGQSTKGEHRPAEVEAGA